jgi:putative membrane protein
MADKQALSEADHVRVSAAVHSAEAGTAGEIVTIITARSDRYQDVALWWAIGFGVAALASLAAFPNFYQQLVDKLSNGWLSEFSVAEAFELALAVALVSIGLVRLILEWMPLRLFLTPRIVKARRVRGRAIRYFKVGAERRTLGRTGILIYLSTDEHMAEIVADEAIHGKIDQSLWGEAMAKLVGGARAGQLTDGMVAAIDDVGALLSANFPRADDDVNELPDRLIEL